MSESESWTAPALVLSVLDSVSHDSSKHDGIQRVLCCLAFSVIALETLVCARCTWPRLVALGLSTSTLVASLYCLSPGRHSSLCLRSIIHLLAPPCLPCSFCLGRPVAARWPRCTRGVDILLRAAHNHHGRPLAGPCGVPVSDGVVVGRSGEHEDQVADHRNADDPRRVGHCDASEVHWEAALGRWVFAEAAEGLVGDVLPGLHVQSGRPDGHGPPAVLV